MKHGTTVIAFVAGSRRLQDRADRGGEPEPDVTLLLAGAIVQRVDVGPALVLLRLRAPGKTRWVVIAAGPRGRVGVLAEKPWKGTGIPGGPSPEGEKIRFRMKVDGARIEAIGPRGVQLAKGEARVTIAVVAGAITLGDAPVEGAAREDAEEALRAEGAALAGALGEGALAARRQELARALGKASARIERRVEAIRGDLGRIAEADGLAAQASSFVAAAARAPRGARELGVTDWSTGEPRPIALAVDPARPALEQVEAMFKRSRRLKLGAAIAGSGSARPGRRRRRSPRRARGSRRRRRWRRSRRWCARRARGAAGLRAGRDGDRRGRPRGARRRRAEPAVQAVSGRGGRADPGGARGGAQRRAHLQGGPAPRFLAARQGTERRARHRAAREEPHLPGRAARRRGPPGGALLGRARRGRGRGAVHAAPPPAQAEGIGAGLVIVDREKVLVLRVERGRLARLLAAEEA